jgi:uncharacterized membrane protein (UPF0127 family)
VTKTKLIVNLTSGDRVCVGELADRPLLRMRGLMGRHGLPAGEGLLVTPAPAIHTAFMRFPIDALFLDRDLRVLDIAERVAPWRIVSKARARAVLELAAGECARRHVEVGDRLELRDREPPLEPAASEDRSADQPARLHRMRVLVVSSDRHFRTGVSLLLARRNCSVLTTANAGRVTELVFRERPDVVVIDTGKLAAALSIATADGAGPRPGVVLVAEEAHSDPGDPLLIPKWGPFEELMAAIERADRRRETRRNGDA